MLRILKRCHSVFSSSLISRPKHILKSLPKHCDVNRFEDFYRYNVENNSREDNIEDFFKFPISFEKLQKYTINRLLKYAYETFSNQNKINSVDVYNNILNACCHHDIEWDVDDLLTDMNERGIKMNIATRLYLIRLYSKNGDIKSIMKLIDDLKELDFKIPVIVAHAYGAFIRVGKIDEGNQYIKEEKINQNDFDFLNEAVYAYASIASFDMVLDLLKRINCYHNEKLSHSIPRVYLQFVKSNAPAIQLNEILDFIKYSDNKYCMPNIIYLLNRNGLYEHSLNLVINYKKDLIQNLDNVTYVLASFNSDDCPKYINIAAIKLLQEKVHQLSAPLLKNMDFEEMMNELSTNDQSPFCVCCLIRRAIYDKSVKNIIQSIRMASVRFAIKELKISIEGILIPDLLSSNWLSSPQEILETLKEYDDLILASMLIHYLCYGNFTTLKILIEANQHIIQSKRFVQYSGFTTLNVHSLMFNVKFENYDKVFSEAIKITNTSSASWLISNAMVEKLIVLGLKNKVEEMEKVLIKAKELNIVFSLRNLARLKLKIPYHSEVFSEQKFEILHSKILYR